MERMELKFIRVACHEKLVQHRFGIACSFLIVVERLAGREHDLNRGSELNMARTIQQACHGSNLNTLECFH